MNYRHHFHAGNFADVFKHVLMIELFRGLQRKEKGFLFLDTHAGRGRYDLTEAIHGDTLVRRPEFPDGIGRFWNDPEGMSPINEYVGLVRSFDRMNGNFEAAPRFYPGSPWLAHALARTQDRLAFCEKHPEEYSVLAAEFARERRVSVHHVDGYQALRAMLPPLEKRALILIDPPYEERNEFDRIFDAVKEGLGRMPAATMAVWYPLTERARVDEFLEALRLGALPPTWAAEVMIAGANSAVKMKGCGLVVINPPWNLDRTLEPTLTALGERLGQASAGNAKLWWLVPER